MIILQTELEVLKKLHSDKNVYISELGKLSFSINNLKLNRKKIFNLIDDLQAKESQFAKMLEEKYGKGTVDIETGKFTPIA